MRKLMIIIASLPLFGVSAGAWAAAAETPATGPDRVVCRYVMHTGTRFKTKACRTVAEWEKLTEQARRNASEMIDRPFIYDCRKEASGC